MTAQQFDDFRLGVCYYFALECWVMTNKMKVGSSEDIWKENLYRLYILRGYLKILFEYNQVAEGGDDTNFFPLDDMKLLVRKINILLNTNYSEEIQLI